MSMVHLQFLAQISSCSFGDLLQVLMDQSELLKMEGYVSAVDEEPDPEEVATSETFEMA